MLFVNVVSECLQVLQQMVEWLAIWYRHPTGYAEGPYHIETSQVETAGFLMISGGIEVN